jgi:hypothetical protein
MPSPAATPPATPTPSPLAVVPASSHADMHTHLLRQASGSHRRDRSVRP